MSRMRILIAAIAVLGLGRAVHADDNPVRQLPPPTQGNQNYPAAASEPRYLGIMASTGTGSSCGAGCSTGCSTGACGTSSCGTGCGPEKGCLAALCDFFSY